MYDSIIDAVMQNSRLYGNKPAIVDINCAYSYQELIKAVNQMAYWMQSVGLRARDPVVVECTQDCVFVIADLACELLGVVFVPVEKSAKIERVCDIFREVNATCIISNMDYSCIGTCFNYECILREMDRYPGDTNDICGNDRKEAVAEILFTTGTTGQPKGIVLSNAANIAVAENISCGVEMTSDTVELIPLPLSHSHGLRTCYANLYTGATSVIIDGVMNVALFFEMIERNGVNAIDISPTLTKLLLKIAKRGLTKYADNIDYIEIGTAVLEDDTKKQLKEIFTQSRLYNFYGSTEAGRSCVLDFNQFDETGCIGYPSKNAAFFIVDDYKVSIESSKENPGLIAVSGDMMMNEYFGSEELTKATLIDGILYTNDLGYIDKEGRVYVIGRKDDIINYKGIKIAPEEIESIALQYDGISDCACVPKQDELCGQVPMLFVSVNSPEQFEEQHFMEYLRQNLEVNRIPNYISIIEKIPRSSNGKIQRKRLREHETD